MIGRVLLRCVWPVRVRLRGLFISNNQPKKQPVRFSWEIFRRKFHFFGRIHDFNLNRFSTAKSALRKWEKSIFAGLLLSWFPKTLGRKRSTLSRLPMWLRLVKETKLFTFSRLNHINVTNSKIRSRRKKQNTSCLAITFTISKLFGVESKLER